LIFTSLSSQAALRSLVGEYLETNMNIKANELDIKSAKYNVDLTEAQNDTFFTSVFSLNDEEPVGFFNFQQLNTKTYFGSLSFSKQTSWGATFNLTQEVFKYDLREWPVANQPPSGPQQYGVNTRLTYTQDLGSNFFGLEYRTDLAIAEATAKRIEADLSIANQQLLYGFLTTYLNTKLEKTLVELSKEALKRATKRRRVISKRVKDRVSKRVDLYQAQIQEMSQQEILKKRERSYLESVDSLNSSVHRILQEPEVAEYNLTDNFLPGKVEGSLERNLDLQSLKESLQLAKLNLKKSRRGYYPTIALQGSYETNSIRDQFNEAYSRGTFAGHRDSGAVSLTVSIPLGMTQADAQTAQSNYELQKTDYMLKKTQKDLISTMFNLERRADSLKEEIEISRNKRKLAKKSLKEENRLYYLGRRNLVDVIRAEETLIQTEVDLANNLTIYHLLLGQYATVKGKLLSFIFSVESIICIS
jgi:outer membrane protein TolC